ncbi:MAG: efflux RND transporter periplasmic adaptor subunit [Rhodoferax sp.]|nr:efflux RND transporter periplasmic adaptor subunit [Rhodoferax sp.]
MSSLPLFRKTLWWIFLAACTALAASLLGWRWWHGTEVVGEPVLRRDFVQTVVASGRVENPHRIDIGAQVTSTVLRVPVQEGQTVRTGDLLIQLSNDELRAAERLAEMGLAQAQARLRQLQEVQAPVAEQALRQAQVTADFTRATLRRSEDLFAKNFIGTAALDEARKSAELAQAQQRSAQQQLASAGPQGSDFPIAQTAVAQAQAGVAAARARSQYAQIRAPVDGVLISRNVEAGDVVQPGKLLMTLSPLGRSQLVLAIDEKNLHLLALGQKALVSADAYPQTHFEATLVFINPGVNPQTGAVDVKLDVAQPPAFLRQDMTASVDIEVAQRKATLLVSAGVVHAPESTQPWVLRVEGTRASKVPVQLGVRSAGFYEVLGGVQEGELLLPTSAAVAPGDRVSLRAPSH